MDNAAIANYFKVWMSQADWETDSHKFYRSLGHLIRSAPTLPAAETIAAGLQIAHDLEYGQPVKRPFMIGIYSDYAKVVIDYLRATE